MISSSSAFASSTPATSAKVAFFFWSESKRARLLPKERALLPPLCICRIKKTHKPISNNTGAQDNKNCMRYEFFSGKSTFILTCFSRSRRMRSASRGIYVLKRLLAPSTPIYSPVIFSPSMRIPRTRPCSTRSKKSLYAISRMVWPVLLK